jgi:hypothetical protein
MGVPEGFWWNADFPGSNKNRRTPQQAFPAVLA